MTEEEKRLVADAYESLMRRAKDTPRVRRFHEDCVRAVFGAAVLLERDPIEFARLMSDGRIAYYIRDGEISIPLRLDDAEPAREDLKSVMESAADEISQTCAHLRAKMEHVTKQLEVSEKEFRSRAARVQSARYGSRHKTGLVHGHR